MLITDDRSVFQSKRFVDKLFENAYPTMKPTEPTPATKAARIISPEIAAIRAKYKAETEALRKDQASAKILKSIVETDLPKLTPTDTAALRKHLETTVQK